MASRDRALLVASVGDGMATGASGRAISGLPQPPPQRPHRHADRRRDLPQPEPLSHQFLSRLDIDLYTRPPTPAPGPEDHLDPPVPALDDDPPPRHRKRAQLLDPSVAVTSRW